jgi:hypothetical protein
VREDVHVEIEEPDRKAQRAFAKEILSDPETFGAASLLAARAARNQVLLDNAKRESDRNRAAERVASGD